MYIYLQLFFPIRLKIKILKMNSGQILHRCTLTLNIKLLKPTYVTYCTMCCGFIIEPLHRCLWTASLCFISLCVLTAHTVRLQLYHVTWGSVWVILPERSGFNLEARVSDRHSLWHKMTFCHKLSHVTHMEKMSKSRQSAGFREPSRGHLLLFLHLNV